MTTYDHRLHPDDIPLDQKTPPTVSQSIRVLRSWRHVLLRSKIGAVHTHATGVALVATAITLVVHWNWAMHSHKAADFARAGALVSLFTALLLVALATWSNDKGFLDGGHLSKFHPLAPSFVVPALAAFGTILWGYGDLLPWFDVTPSCPDTATLVRTLIDAHIIGLPGSAP